MCFSVTGVFSKYNIQVPPCIMCFQYCGGGGGVLSTVGDVQCHGGYHEYRRGISWVLWGCSVPWGISWLPWGKLSTVGDIMSTVGDLSLFEYLTVLNTLHGTHDIPQMYHDIPPRYSNYKRWYGTEYPPMVLSIPTVLSIPHGTQDKPHGTHDIPHSTHDIPHSTEHPAPVLNTPHPTVLNTHYTGRYSLSFIMTFSSFGGGGGGVRHWLNWKILWSRKFFSFN